MSGETTGAVRVLLRLEGLCALIAASVAYSEFSHSKFGQGWGLFALFFLAPDISFLGYLVGVRAGSVIYNLAHTYLGAAVCLLIGFLLPEPVLLFTGLIWCAHIGFDRALGYGLKYPAAFGATHLGRIGRDSVDPPNPSVIA